MAQSNIKFETCPTEKINCTKLLGREWIDQLKYYINFAIENATNMTDGVGDSPHSICISLRNTSVRHIDSELQLNPYRKNFTILKMENNGIRSIASDAFDEWDAANLWRFSLHGNNLTELPQNFFENFEHLKELNLSENVFQNFSAVQINAGE